MGEIDKNTLFSSEGGANIDRAWGKRDKDLYLISFLLRVLVQNAHFQVLQ